MKNRLNEQINNVYNDMVKSASYRDILKESEEAKTVEDFDNINNKMFFTCQTIKQSVEKHFPNNSKAVLEDLAAHIVAALK